ncbi:50S ribosomal protein L13 [Candidatus Bathyarchaeota archaeon]|nr:50S ribosomal protein L13 [Candidatus Bathyarchaeota archaeon]
MSIRTIIDADGLILGRMASIVAKKLLAGESVEIVNAQAAIVSGNRTSIIEAEKEFLSVGGHRKGPTHFKQPNDMVRRTIRGMLPYRQPKGRDAFKRLKVHIGVPRELETLVKVKIPEASVEKLNNRYITVGAIAESIGWRKYGVE